MEKPAELRRKFVGLNGTLYSYYIVCLLKEIYMLDLRELALPFMASVCRICMRDQQ